ncbi:uncharacterized protein [Nicotiana sylvestris]|uniref:Uncharacterized protein n=2 Tax=Nicotiana TaxID=4085 RepID=A0A1S4DDG3_TOBAC|nr:PREDICTED: uncharacterized protein LOC104231959 [Nicotiana sylvestris]XP_016511249.1 PREDICTED: uncharacterized protein LOC107828456 [Nicotiana tabacum]
MMKRVSLSEKLACDYQAEANNWKEQFESLQIDMEISEESKCTLEQQVRVLTSELVVEKVSSNQAGEEKNLLETSFSKQLSKASEEIRELKTLLGKKEAYAGELVQTLTQTQKDFRVSSDKVRSLENSYAFLQTSYDSALAENEKLTNKIADWERDYEILEDKTAIEMKSELAKIKETIEKTQHSQDFPSPVAEASGDVEDDMGTPIPSSQIEPAAAEDPALVPSSTPQ